MYSWKVKTRAFREIKPHKMLEDLSMVLGVTCVDFKKPPSPQSGPFPSIMGSHVPGEVVAFPEGFITYGALKFLLSPPLHQGFHGILFLVVGPHVVHQIRGHPEGSIALGAPVLRWQTQGGEGRGQEGKGGRQLQLEGCGGALWPKSSCKEEGALLWHGSR